MLLVSAPIAAPVRTPVTAEPDQGERTVLTRVLVACRHERASLARPGGYGYSASGDFPSSRPRRSSATPIHTSCSPSTPGSNTCCVGTPVAAMLAYSSGLGQGLLGSGVSFGHALSSPHR